MNQKPKEGIRLHKQVALGKKPKQVATSKGLNSSTVPGKKGKK